MLQLVIKVFEVKKLCNSLIGLAIIIIFSTNNVCYANSNIATINQIHPLNTLENVPLNSFGLKMLLVYNSTNSIIKNISFPDKAKLPTDITYADRTTCILDGTLQLKPNENCIIVFKYAPRIEGVNSLLSIAISGVSSNNTVTLTAENIPYSSRITNQIQPETQIGLNPQIGLILTDLDPASISYKRDSLEKIKVGYLGLKTYKITNTSLVNLYAISLPVLPSGFSYDTTRTTCSRLDNKLMLKPDESCNIVIKYMPINSNDSGRLQFQVAGVDDYYTVVTNKILNIPYSSYLN